MLHILRRSISMTTIFVSHAKEDTESAEQIRQGLESLGYKVWREPVSLSMESILYPRTIENVILGRGRMSLFVNVKKPSTRLLRCSSSMNTARKCWLSWSTWHSLI